MLELVLTSLIILVAFGGEALFGFGGGMVAVPSLSLFLDVPEAVVLVVVFQFLLGFLAVKNYRLVAWALLPSLFIGMVFGVVLGVVILPVASQELLRLLLALYIAIFLVKEWLAPGLGATSASWLGGATAGAISGFFQGCLGIGGPPMVIYLRKLVADVRAFRASVIFCLSIANLMRIPLVGYQDLFSFRVIQLASGALPAFGIAVLLGQRYHQRIPEALYFRIVYALLTLTALTLVAKVVL